MNIYDYAEDRKISIRQVFDFTLLSNPIGPSNKARNAMRKALKMAPLLPDMETRRLRRLIASRERIEPGNILFGHGSTPLLDLILARLKPRKVLIPGPLPLQYEPLLQRHGAVIVSCPVKRADGFSLDLQRLSPLMAGVDMLLLPNPHWMTGSLILPSDLQTIGEAMKGTNKTLVLDEGLIEYTQDPHGAEGTMYPENTLVLRTFSFYYALAGLRLGYVFGSEPILTAIKGAIDPGPVNTVATTGAIASLKDPGFRKRSEEFVRAEKAYLVDRLRRMEGVEVMDTSCNFLLARIVQGAVDPEEFLFRRHILVEPFKDEDGLPFIRIAVRNHRENAQFVKTLGAMLTRFRKAGPS